MFVLGNIIGRSAGVFVRHDFYLVVLGAALVLEQGDTLPVQEPVMTFPLRTQTFNEVKDLKNDLFKISEPRVTCSTFSRS